MPRPTQPRLPADVLIGWVRRRLPPEQQNINAVAEWLGVNPRNLWRWTVEDVPLYAADALAVSLGLHPAEIWGNAYWDLPLEEPA